MPIFDIPLIFHFRTISPILKCALLKYESKRWFSWILNFYILLFWAAVKSIYINVYCKCRTAVWLTQQLLNAHVGGWQWKVNPDSHYLITHHQSCKNSISPHHIFVQLAQVLVTEITSPCDLVFQKCCFNRLLPQSAVAGLTISHEKKRDRKETFVQQNDFILAPCPPTKVSKVIDEEIIFWRSELKGQHSHVRFF